jgi:hypothetical protein
MTVSSNAGGSLAVVFTDKADASQKATLNVTVAPKEFQAVARVDGEVEAWSLTETDNEGAVTQSQRFQRTVLMEEGKYGVETAFGTPDTYSSTRGLYDAQDRYLGYANGLTGTECLYDTPVANVSYPLHVGKTWSGDATRNCADLKLSQHYSRRVEAYEKVVTPEGSHDALRITAVVAVSADFADPVYTDYSYTLNSTCWWAIDLGRHVKCDFAYRFDDGSSDSRQEVMTSLTR